MEYFRTTVILISILGLTIQTQCIDKVSWHYDICLMLDHTNREEAELIQPANQLMRCVLSCLLESPGLDERRFPWGLSQQRATSISDVLTASGDIEVTCAKNSTDPRNISRWASYTYTDASLIGLEDECKPSNFPGLKRNCVNVTFECTTGQGNCNDVSICEVPVGKSSFYEKHLHDPSDNPSSTAAIVGGAVGAAALASLIGALSYYVRQRKKAKVADGPQTSPQGSTVSLIPEAFIKLAAPSRVPTRTTLK